MANKDYSPDIRDLETSLSYYATNSDKLTQSDLKVLSKAYSLYTQYCESLLGYSVDPRIKDVYSFQKYVKISEINDLISKFFNLNHEKKEEKEEEKKEVKKPEQEAVSIPPELESMVAEYRQNQADLAAEEIKSNSQKTVAQQVKIAIAHSKIKQLALANRQRRSSQGEKFQKSDDALVTLGSPKSKSVNDALNTSYDAVKQVAFTYGAFSKLPHELQNEIITSAVELNTVGVSDIYTAIQASTLQVDTSNFDDSVKNNLATIPGGFVSTVYQEIVSSNNKTAEYEAKISTNEEEIQKLLKEGKTEEIKTLVEENQHLQAFNESQSVRLSNVVAKQTESFQKFEASRKAQLSKDPDLLDRIELANQTVANLNNNLEKNGVVPHIFTAMDDADLLEKAIRQDLPGTLRSSAGYEASYAAAIISNPKTQDPNLSPQAVLLAGKELTPGLLTQAREFAQKNPETSLGKLYKARKDLFDSTGVQLRKILGSPLGKEVYGAKVDAVGNLPKTTPNFFNKISDRAGGLGKVIRVVQNPVGALRSWAGRKAGEQIMKRFVQTISSETLKKGAQMLLQNGVKQTVKTLSAKAVAKMTAWAATKLGISLALESTNAIAPGVGFLIDVAVQALLWIGEKTIGFVKKAIDNISRSIYGEEIKARDLIAIPVAGAVAVGAGITSFATVVVTATIVAAQSAVGIIIMGTFLGIIFYITSVISGPLVSTLVQLESSQPINKGTGLGVLDLDCGTDAGQEILVDAGGYPVTKRLLTGPGRTGLCITPTKITIHWSGAWTDNNATYNTLVQRGLSCQIGTDQDGSVEQWQQMWEKKAELAWCSGGNENNYCLNNEMVGAYFIPPGSSLAGQAPSFDEIQSAVNSTCFMMKQYSIPSSQIFGHYQLQAGKPDPGKEFLEYFIERVNKTCP